MKKLTVFFVLLAALTAFGSVFAQAGAPLDMTVAEPYLGTWFISELCGQGQCMDASLLGMSGSSVEFTDDASMTMIVAGEEQGTMPWYTENGNAYACSTGEESECTWLPMSITDEGKLSMGDEDYALVLIRDEIKPFGTAEVKPDAAYDDFQGEWFLESMIGDGVSIPASLFGMSAKLVIREDSLDYSMSNPMDPEESRGQDNAPYEIADGTLTVTFTRDGESETATMQYHVDDSIVAEMEGGNLVFVREENLTTGLNLLDLLSEAFSEGAGDDTKYVSVGSTDYRIGIPESYEEGELTEEDLADNMTAYWHSGEYLMDFDIYQFAKEGQTYIDYARTEAAAYGVDADDVADWQVNGIDMAQYYSSREYEGETINCVTWIWEAGDDFVRITFWLDGDDAEGLADQIIFSLELAE